MLQEISQLTSDVSVLWRLLIAAVHISDSTPNRWDIISNFAFEHSAQKCSTRDVKLLLDNVEFLDKKAFATDTALMAGLISLKRSGGEPLGVVLISDNTACKQCDGKLLVRADRPSRVTIYTETMGTVPGTHFHKYCQNSRKGCSFAQHYSYSTNGEESETIYDEDWQMLPYFVSTHQTAFEMQLLKRLDADILIGQMTYNQSCDMYNYVHRYGVSCNVDKETARETDDDERYVLHTSHASISWVFTTNSVPCLLFDFTVHQELPLSSVTELDLTIENWKMLINFVCSVYTQGIHVPFHRRT